MPFWGLAGFCWAAVYIASVLHSTLVLLTSIAQASTSPEGVEAARRATLMFTLVALSLGVLLLVVVLLIAARRTQRRQANAPKPTGVLVDPWSESARRVQPFDSQDRAD